jgi:hypothetical protein
MQLMNSSQLICIDSMHHNPTAAVDCSSLSAAAACTSPSTAASNPRPPPPAGIGRSAARLRIGGTSTHDSLGWLGTADQGVCSTSWLLETSGAQGLHHPACATPRAQQTLYPPPPLTTPAEPAALAGPPAPQPPQSCAPRPRRRRPAAPAAGRRGRRPQRWQSPASGGTARSRSEACVLWGGDWLVSWPVGRSRQQVAPGGWLDAPAAAAPPAGAAYQTSAGPQTG